MNVQKEEKNVQTISNNLNENDGFIYVDIPMVLENQNFAPQYMSEEAACADLYALIPPNIVGGVDVGSKIILQNRTGVKVRTGIKMAIPRGYKLCVSARSGFAEKGLLVSNAPAQIDSDYRGEVMLLLRNVGQEIIQINNGERIAQCWLDRVIRIKPNIVIELPKTERNEGGFGSTGK